VPKPKQGRISTYLAKEESEDDTIMLSPPMATRAPAMP